VNNRQLVVNDDEACIVVEIYRRYLALKLVHALRDELADAGIKSKRRTRPDGAEYGSQKLSRGALYLILQNTSSAPTRPANTPMRQVPPQASARWVWFSSNHNYFLYHLLTGRTASGCSRVS
jgi:hypothetical protein